MPKRAYNVPGVQATIIDYQITPAPITNPGEIVVLLGDLPDTVGVSDPANPGSTIQVAIPKNVPILINNESNLGIVSGSQLKTALLNLSGADRNLEIVNALPMLSSSLPLAICKITRRNGERPDSTNTLEVYEALEYAYEALGNYPAGRVVPMPISIEDSVLKTALASNTLEVFDQFNSSAIPGDFGSNIFTSAAQTDMIMKSNVAKYQNGINVKIAPVVNDTDKLGIKFDFTIGGVEIFTKTVTANEIVSTGSSIPIDLILYADGSNGTRKKYEDLYDLVYPGGTKITSPVNVPTADHVALVQDTTLTAKLLEANDHERFTIIDPTVFATTTDGASRNIALDTIKFDILDGSTTVAEFIYNATLNAPTNGITYGVSTATVDWSALTSDSSILDYANARIAPTEWFEDTTFLLLDDSGTAITDPLTKEEVDASTAIIAEKTLPVGESHSDSSPVSKQAALDRSFNIVETYSVANETYSKEPVLINSRKEANFYTVSSTFNIEGFVPDYNGEPALIIDDVHVSLPTLTVVGGPDEFFVAADHTFVYNNLVELTLYKGLKLPKKSGAFEYQVSVVPSGASFDKRLVQFCVDLTKDLNDCSAVLGTIPPVTTSSEDIDKQVTRLSQNLASKNFVTATVDNGLYLTVTTGSQKVSGTGGITNFKYSKVASFDVAAKTVNVLGSLGFVVGDKIDLEILKKGRYYIMENVVTNIVETLNGFQLTVKDSFSDHEFGNLNNNSTRNCYLANTKDRKGSYLAALYAVQANNFGVDKAPFNQTLPGTSEVFYTRTQVSKLLDVKLTPINRNAFNTSGVVIDTPTMARDESDFTDQGTVGLIFYFIRQLRNIANARKGERFGSGDRQIVFQTELEAPFNAQLGSTIEAFDLQIDWTKLNTNHTMDIEFKIREAKKLKFVTISAKLF